MIATRLNISNYRGFSQVTLEFDPRITVLAGWNGSGKSSTLSALAILLSHLLKVAGPSKDAEEVVSAEDIHIGKSALTLSGTFRHGGRTHHVQVTRSIPDPTKAEEYAKRRNKARFAIRSTRKGSKKHKELLEEIRFLDGLLDQGEPHFTHQVEGPKRPTAKGPKSNPLAILYATSRYLDRIAPTLSKATAFEPAIACEKALNGLEVSLTAFANWFRAAQRGAFGSKAQSKRLVLSLNEVVEALLPGFSEPRVTDEVRPKVLVRKNRTEFDVRQLSDGERGLLALAFDLTRRLAIANPGLKDPVAEGAAIVLLDEIELHLHPSWQRKVLGRLVDTFKSCQFIATTHSPQVLGESPPGSVWMLDIEDGRLMAWKPDRFFGMDSNRLLEELMGAESINVGVKADLHKIAELIDRDQFSQAERAISDLEPKLGVDHPELIRLRSLIAFITRKK